MNGNFLISQEKSVISNLASAGTYIFKNISTYLHSLAFILDNPEAYSYKDLFYVCPLFNGVSRLNLLVESLPVTLIYDPKNH